MDKDTGKKLFRKFEKYLKILNPLNHKTKTDIAFEKKINIEILEHNNISWIDIENPKRKELSEYFEKYKFHNLHIEACVSAGELDRIEIEDDYIFILLHSPSYNSIEKKIISSQVCIFIGKDYVITIHRNKRKSLYEAFLLCKENEEIREAFFKKSSSRLLHSILSVFEKDVSELLHSILQEMDEIEDLVFDIKISGIYRISQLRQKIVRLRRVTSSFREITQNLVTLQHSLTMKSNRYFKNISNNFNKLFEVLEETRETVEIYKDADFTVSTERTNKILTVLTIVFTLSIPTTVIGSIYGMNILTPGGVGAESWNILGEFTTFYLTLGASILSAILMLVYFKYRDWF